MILKVLLVVGVIGLVYFMFIKKKPEISQKKQKNNTKEEKPKVQSNDMVECSGCGVYCAMDDTILSNNKYYCSKECIEKKH